MPASKTTADFLKYAKRKGTADTIVASGKCCEAGTEHVDWIHLGDASGAANCLDRVLDSAYADAGKQCDLESGLYSLYVAGSPVGTSCVCPIVGSSQADGVGPLYSSYSSSRPYSTPSKYNVTEFLESRTYAMWRKDVPMGKSEQQCASARPFVFFANQPAQLW